MKTENKHKRPVVIGVIIAVAIGAVGAAIRKLKRPK